MSDCQECVEHKKQDSTEHWLQKFWRPAMAVQYFIICIFDFMLAPIMLTFYTVFMKLAYIPWEPLTLQGAGLYHLSMGAILGVTAYTRGQEKIANAKS
jgi:hypothetical protein